MNTRLDYYSVLKEVRSFIGNTGLGLQFVEGLQVPYTDGRDLFLAQPQLDWDDDQTTRWRASMYHEAGHNDAEMRDLFDVIKAENIDMSSLVGTAMNIVDDYRQEKHKLGVYIGRDKCLSKGNALIVSDILEKRIANGRNPDMPELTDMAILDAMQAWSMHERANWQKDTVGMGRRWRDELLNDVQQEFFDKLLSSFAGRLDALRTAQDELELVLEILEGAAGRNADEEMEKAKKAGEGSGEEQAGQQGDSDGEGDGEGAEGMAGAGSGEEGDQGEGAGGVIKYEDFLLHNHAEQASSPGSADGSAAGVTYDYSGHTGSGFDLDANIKVEDYTRAGREAHGFVSAVRGIASGNGLANKIRALLQVKTQTLKVYGQKRGKIANKSLHRAALKNTGSYQQRVFSRKENRYDLDCAVSVLVDFSGSMWGDKIQHAAKSMELLNDAIAGIGVPVEVLGFTDDNHHGLISIIKRFDERTDGEELLHRTGASTEDQMGYNADGEAILFAYDRLMKRQEKRKILIVLSDGQPASHRGDAAGLTLRVTDQIQRAKKCELYGIGIMDGSVERFYKHHKVIRSASQLEEAVLTVVRDHILS